MSEDVHYSSYLAIDELLNLQRCLSDEHDELQFIIVHQVFELWFKLILFELESTRVAMQKGDVPVATRLLRRVTTIQRAFIGQFDVIETMRPTDFLRFRQRLEPASGFQSVQFREIEFISGAKDERFLKMHRPAAVEKLRQRMQEPTLWDAFVELMRRRGLAVDTDQELVASLVQLTRGDGELAQLSELADVMLEYDEAFALWRNRHVRMTERVIGARTGTGAKDLADLVKSGYNVMGSGGADYLKSTLEKRFFPRLWEARTQLLL
jgi:tryptophan 2,3-dioxygenase